MKTYLISLLISLIVTILAGWIILVQTENRNKFLAFLVFVWAVFNIYQNFSNYRKNLPKPHLILYTFDQHYNTKPPSSATFFMKIKNIGNGTAENVYTHQIHYIDDEIRNDRTDNQADIEPDQTVRLRFNLSGNLFQEIWEGKRKLRVKLVITYSDKYNRKYPKLEEESEYNPMSNQNVFAPEFF